MPEISGFGRVRLVISDFDGVLTDNSVFVNQDGVESVRCWRGDGIGINNLQNAGIPFLVVSTESNPVVQARCKKLRVDACINGVENKSQEVIKIARKYQVPLESVMFIGNDINDLEALEIVGVPVVVADSHPDIFRTAKYITKLPGGYGAVREVCDLIVNTGKS